MDLLTAIRALLSLPVSTDEASAEVSPAIAPPAVAPVITASIAEPVASCSCQHKEPTTVSTTVLNETATATTTADKEVVAPVALAASTAPLTEDEFLALAPASIRSMVEAHRAADLATRATLVATITSAAASVFTADELNAKSTAELTQLSALVEAVTPAADYSGRTVIGAATNTTAPSVPKPWSQALAAAK